MLPTKAMKDDDAKLKELKEKVEASHQYFKDNCTRFHEFMKFVFMTNLTNQDTEVLNLLNKPIIEFNILEANISRLLGEFVKQTPSVTAKASEGVRLEDLSPEFLETVDVIEAHVRAILLDSTNDHLKYRIYRDLLAGGFSVIKVYTDYINEMSFEQNIKVERVFDPTLCGFDPLARESHKGDGEYCFECFPRTKEEFEAEFGKEVTASIKFERTPSVGSFQWSYENMNRDIVMLVEMFVKVRKREKIVKLSNGHVVLKKHYEDFINIWNSQGFIEQVPVIVSTRETILETIDRYIFCESKILSKEETSDEMFRLVFVDGNSVDIRESGDGSSTQMTRPYVYQAKGIQRLKNFAGQSVANEIENLVQHKFIVSKESIPEAYKDAYKNIQQMSTLVYNAFYEGNPQIPLPPPREVQRTPTPPIVETTFLGSDRVSQAILGQYDAVLGTNDQQISGVAIQQGALQSNAAAIPFLVGFIRGYDRVANILLSFIPKYYVTPRSIPTIKMDGKRDFKIINAPGRPGSVDMSYNPKGMQITVEAGVSSGVQKQVALEKIVQMMQASEVFAQFINTMGLETLIDNLDIRGVDHLKAQAAEFMQMQQQAQEEQQGKPSPEEQQAQVIYEIEMAKTEQMREKSQGDLAVQSAKVANEKQLTDIKYLEVMAKVKEMEAKLEQSGMKLMLDQEKTDSENARTAVETAISFAEQVTKKEDLAFKRDAMKQKAKEKAKPKPRSKK